MHAFENAASRKSEPFDRDEPFFSSKKGSAALPINLEMAARIVSCVGALIDE